MTIGYAKISDPLEAMTRIIFETGAFSVNTADPFIYTSKKIGADYVDMGEIQNYPEAWDKTIEYLADAIKSVVDVKKIDRISGGEVRDLIFSIRVASKLGIPHVIIRKEKKSHGVGGRFIGKLNPGDYVVHVADLMNYGSSSDSWVPAIREERAIIEYYFEGFDRLQGGTESLLKFNPPVKNISIARRDKRFYEIGTELGFIKDRKQLDEFNRDPINWPKKYLLEHPEFILRHTKIADGHIIANEGLEVLIKGYPELIPELGPNIANILKEREAVDSIPEIGYKV